MYFREIKYYEVCFSKQSFSKVLNWKSIYQDMLLLFNFMHRELLINTNQVSFKNTVTKLRESLNI